MAGNVVVLPDRESANRKQGLATGLAIAQALGNVSDSILNIVKVKQEQKAQELDSLLRAGDMFGGLNNLPAPSRNRLAELQRIEGLPVAEDGGVRFPVPVGIELKELQAKRELIIHQQASAGDPKAQERLDIMDGLQKPNLGPQEIQLKKDLSNAVTNRMNFKLSAQRANLFVRNDLEIELEKFKQGGRLKGKALDSINSRLLEEDKQSNRIDLEQVRSGERRNLEFFKASKRDELERLKSSLRSDNQETDFVAFEDKNEVMQAIPASTAERLEPGVARKFLTRGQRTEIMDNAKDIYSIKAAQAESAIARLSIQEKLQGPDVANIMEQIQRMAQRADDLDDDSLKQGLSALSSSMMEPLVASLLQDGRDPSIVDDLDDILGKPGGFFSSGQPANPTVIKSLEDAYNQAVKRRSTDVARVRAVLDADLPEANDLPGDVTDRRRDLPATIENTPDEASIDAELDRLIRQGDAQGFTSREMMSQLIIQLGGGFEAEQKVRDRFNKHFSDKMRQNPPRPR
jgi:hypothetical protein